MPTKLTPGASSRSSSMQRRAGRAAEVVDVGALARAKSTASLADHALDLGVERHRARQHVVEDVGHVRAELEVGDAVVRLRENLVTVLGGHV